ncbi:MULTISPECIES: TetR/AcrR family transcriptional regulator [unclassified Adlercreutzia]|uniref:TetR/AcrR family transcriptional regulator n=1 Tax=unclassified Adlercreutzia TaxID=2636013 RepID=UPI0013EACC44|nr:MULTISPECIES: helix-turn-helix domain-containing protein [unclassified Adlercreutzia]
MPNNNRKDFDVFNAQELRIRMGILHAVDKSLDRMTVSEICKNAGVSRQTFYRYFESKYDIPCWHTIYCRQFYLNEIGRTIGWETGYYHHIRLIFQEYDFYSKSIQYSVNTPFGRSILPEDRKKVLLETLEKYRHEPINRNMLFIVETFARLECEVMNDWLRSSRPADLESWTEDLVSIVPTRLFRALDLKDPKGLS